jgi:hypothetical protein
MTRATAYLLTNLTFIVVLSVGLLMETATAVHPLYLILIFALCTSPIFSIRQFNDRYALLALYCAVFFLFYGLLDFINVFSNVENPLAFVGVLSKTELAILLGGALAIAGYHIACRFASASALIPAADWPERIVILFGGALWVLCTWATWQFRVHVIVDTTNEATARGLTTLNGVQTAAFIVAEMLQSVSIIMLAYAQCKYQRRYMSPLLIAVVLVQLAFGFVVDIKSAAFLGAGLVVITKLLLDGKLPKLWLVSIIVFVALAFPVLQANRWVRGTYGVDHTQAALNIRDTVKKAINASNLAHAGSDRAQTIFERMSLKGSVELIVSKTGISVPFKNGYTLIPLLTALVPRLIWPTKLDVQSGQVMNKDFHVSEVSDTYISPSHLGELYWNFGWKGIVLGMPLIGLLLGAVGTRCDLSRSVGITRLLVVVITARLLILGSEGTISVEYSLWVRSLLAIGVFHILFAKQTRHENKNTEEYLAVEKLPATEARAAPPFPNLMK